jgi:hypothetical protein
MPQQGCALRPDAQAFDEVRIVTIPRFKESEFSGDEWRIHAETQFYRKGKLIFSEGCRDVQTACGLAFGWYVRACDDGKGYFAGDGLTCDQEGCHEPATIRYARKFDYGRDGARGKREAPAIAKYRHFCEQHQERGDAAFDDSDSNYDPAPVEMP